MQSGCGRKASLLVADFMKGNASPAHSIVGVVGGVLVMQVFLETERLVLRRFIMSDADNLEAYS